MPYGISNRREAVAPGCNCPICGKIIARCRNGIASHLTKHKLPMKEKHDIITLLAGPVRKEVIR